MYLKRVLNFSPYRLNFLLLLQMKKTLVFHYILHLVIFIGEKGIDFGAYIFL